MYKLEAEQLIQDWTRDNPNEKGANRRLFQF